MAPVLAIQPASRRLAAVCPSCHNSGKDWRIRRPAVTSMDVMVRYAKAVYRPWNTIFQTLIVLGLAVTCAVRQQRFGHIINMSSVGGYQGTIVEPSYFRTDFLDIQLLGRTRQ